MLASAAMVVQLVGCSGGGGGSCRRSAPSTSGPGDVSNYFPLSVGSRWTYETLDTSNPYSTQRSRWSVEVTGTRPTGSGTAVVFVATPADGTSPPEEALFASGPSGVTEFATPTDGPPLDQIYPFQVITFPLEAGSAFEQFSCSGLNYGQDVDGDFRNEVLDARSTVTVVGEETVLVPAGNFVAMRVDTLVTMTLHATRGQTQTVSGTQSVWYVPGVGRVRSSSTMSNGGYATQSSEETLLGYDVEGRRAGLIRSAALATDLSPAISDTETPGRPAIAFDGSGHLLVAKTDPSIGGWQDESLRAQVLAADGSTTRQFVLAARTGYGLRPAAAFSGVNHLVASSLCAADCSTIFAQRVTPAGDLLDGESGFDLTVGGRTVYPPSVASDGSGWLVAWTRYLGGLEVARVSASGALLGTFQVRGSVAPVSQALAFGGVYLLAWIEGQSVLAARIDPSGAILDDPPIAVSTAPSDKSMGGVTFDGTRFLVVWGDSRRGDTWINGAVHDVYAARVAPDGTLLDGPADTGGIVVNAFPGQFKADPVVAFDGTRFVVTWWIDGFYGDVGVFAARVGGDGALLDGPVSGTGMSIAGPFAYGSRLVHPVVVPAAGGEALFAWVNNTEMSGETKGIGGAWYAW
jgi:hypothetical protein